MQLKRKQLAPIGMNQDLAESKFSEQFTFSNLNLRLFSRGTNSALSIENERGNTPIDFTIIYNIVGPPGSQPPQPVHEEYLYGTCIGVTTLNKYLIVFTHLDHPQDKRDYIYRIELTDNGWVANILGYGNFGFSLEHPLQILPYYETPSIQKVYWVDGINPLRVANIVKNEDGEAPISVRDDDGFDTILNLNLLENITITKEATGGQFPAGTVQYAFSYYNIVGTESKLFYVSPLYYSSFVNRAGSSEELTSNSFRITVDNVDIKYDYLRVYSVIRTSVNTTPQAKIVADIKINNKSTVSIVDTNTQGSDIDPAMLLYIGGEALVLGTITAKDNTLFGGDITIVRPSLNELITEDLNASVVFEERDTADDILLENQNNSQNQYYLYRPTSLDYSSAQVKHFKKGEVYRFGIQFQYSDASWSEVLYIGKDVECNKSYKIIKDLDSKSIYLRLNKAKVSIDKSKLNQDTLKQFVKARLVRVPLTLKDRRVVAQGVVNGSSFTVKERLIDRTTYARADYLLRATATYNSTVDPYSKFMPPTFKYGVSQSTVIPGDVNISSSSQANNYPTHTTDVFGSHFISIPGFWGVQQSIAGLAADDYLLYYFAENQITFDGCLNGFILQNNSFVLRRGNPATDGFILDKNEYNTITSNATKLNNCKNTFLSDENLVTFWSPDIQYGSVKDSTIFNSNDFKAKFVAVALPTANNTELSVTTDGGWLHNSSTGTPNYGKVTYNGKVYHLGNDVLRTQIVKDNTNSSWNRWYYSEFTMWDTQRQMPSSDGSDNWFKITDKKFATYRYSAINYQLDFTPEYDIAPPQVMRREDDTLNVPYKLPYSINGSDNIIYQKAVDELFEGTRSLPGDTNPVVAVRYKSNDHLLFAFKGLSEADNSTTGIQANVIPGISNTSLVHGIITYIRYNNPGRSFSSILYYDYQKEVMGYGNILPLGTKGNTASSIEESPEVNYPLRPVWWIVDIVNNSVKSQYGGQIKENGILKATEESLLSNVWIPCGEPVDIRNNDSQIVLEATEGDTFVQRYNCLRIYPSDTITEFYNNNTEMVSFLCESFINLDGIYDVNRYNIDLKYSTPNNYGLLNEVYSQENNLFTSSILDYSIFDSNKFPSQVIWSSIKQPGARVDSWTSLNTTTVLDLDGTKGRLNKLDLFNNRIIGFQDTGISIIHFNDRVQVPTSDNIPIEITNNYKVSGYTYISDKIGCDDKSLIVRGNNGLYFVSHNQRAIYRLGESLENISLNAGMKSWSDSNIDKYDNKLILDHIGFSGISTYADLRYGDIYFTSNDYCLCFNENIGRFTSFFSYNGCPFMVNWEDRFVSMYGGINEYGGNYTKVYLQGLGKYNEYFDRLKPTEITYIINPDAPYDKIFNNIEFRADAYRDIDSTSKAPAYTEPTNKVEYVEQYNKSYDNYNPYRTFDKIKVWNEYQSGFNDLIVNKTLRKKYMTWRADIPRNSNSLDRIRGQWCYLKLSYNPISTESDNRLRLHDIIIDYTI